MIIPATSAWRAGSSPATSTKTDSRPTMLVGGSPAVDLVVGGDSGGTAAPSTGVPGAGPSPTRRRLVAHRGDRSRHRSGHPRVTAALCRWRPSVGREPTGPARGTGRRRRRDRRVSVGTAGGVGVRPGRRGSGPAVGPRPGGTPRRDPRHRRPCVRGRVGRDDGHRPRPPGGDLRDRGDPLARGPGDRRRPRGRDAGVPPETAELPRGRQRPHESVAPSPPTSGGSTAGPSNSPVATPSTSARRDPGGRSRPGGPSKAAGTSSRSGSSIDSSLISRRWKSPFNKGRARSTNRPFGRISPAKIRLSHYEWRRQANSQNRNG